MNIMQYALCISSVFPIPDQANRAAIYKDNEPMQPLRHLEILNSFRNNIFRSEMKT